MTQRGPNTSRYTRIMKTFSDRLRAARGAKYETAARFAGVLNLDAHTYRKYERGESEPNYDTLVRICELLKITPNDLLPLAAKPTKTPPAQSEPATDEKRDACATV